MASERRTQRRPDEGAPARRRAVPGAVDPSGARWHAVARVRASSAAHLTLRRDRIGPTDPQATGDSMSELRVYPPPAAAVRGATVSGMAAYQALCKEAESDYAGFWGRLAREHVRWKTPFTKSLDDSNAPFFKWFEDGTLNASYNCLDAQVERGLGQKTAIIFEADDGTVTRISYAELLERV